MNVVLISTYELGHQPFGIASPAAWLRAAGATVSTFDIAVERLHEPDVAAADLICLYVPMHTASRIASSLAPVLRRMNPGAHLCFYGLYAPVNEQFFRGLGAATVLGGEFESGLVSLYQRLHSGRAGGDQEEPVVSLAMQDFVVPDRSGLPALDRYASLRIGGQERVAGYTEATRGCKHLCRHCPIVPVYGGRFRAIARDVVLQDVRQQVAAGAEHVTFGDPDFFNGPGHALPLVEALHEEFPELTYDVTIKVEHLSRHADKLETLKRTGCVFITSAVESVDDRVLDYLQKHHTHEQFAEVVRSCRDIGLVLSPTFVTFHPWTTLPGYLDLLETILDLDLVANVAPIQYAIRLLIPAGSLLLELPDICDLVERFDDEALLYPWKHADPRVDQLHQDILAVVEAGSAEDSRTDTFRSVWRLAWEASGRSVPGRIEATLSRIESERAAVPHLSEPWYCCAEPTKQQVCFDQYFDEG